MEAPTIGEILDAAGRIRPLIHRTPVLTCRSLDGLCGARLFFKCENFQKVGAFKIRGAANAVLSLSDGEAGRGVATHSSGNHAAALAQAARWRGIPAHVVMPANSPRVKREAVAGYGAEITLCEPTLEARESTLAEVVARTGAHFVHPYNDPRVVAGQASAALELLEDVPNLDAILAPVGGGGLLSGTALAAAAVAPRVKVMGAEPQAADDAFRSLQAGRIIPVGKTETVADGLRTSLGELTFAVISRHVEGIITVDEAAILRAMRHIWERMKIVVEPSAAVPLAAVMTHGERLAGLGVGIILSGGNVDLDALRWAP
jgi:threonine dehydratase